MAAVADLTVIVPSRGRPEAAAELVRAFADTCTAVTHLMVAVDADDPELDGYRQAGLALHVTPNPERSMVACLNRATADVLAYEPFAVGFMGDDHRPRTVGWDAAYLEALHELGTGLVWGDDLLQGDRIPTQVAMTSDIVGALGWMAPPPLTHLYVDNFWKDLGTQAGCLRYLPDVVVEHMHPVAGKADWDEGHQRVNAPEMYGKDAAAYQRFVDAGHFAAAVTAVRALRGAA